MKIASPFVEQIVDRLPIGRRSGVAYLVIGLILLSGMFTAGLVLPSVGLALIHALFGKQSIYVVPGVLLLALGTMYWIWRELRILGQWLKSDIIVIEICCFSTGLIAALGLQMTIILLLLL